MTTADTVARGRAAFARHAWTEAYTALRSAHDATPLAAEDLELLATAANLLGKDDSDEQWMELAHHEYVRGDDLAGAARTAFWQGLRLLMLGDMARGGGWLGRAHRYVGDRDCVERGFLAIPAALQQLDADPAAAHAAFIEATTAGERFADADLTALGRTGQGEALLRMGQTKAGLALLDEVLVSVETGEISAVPTGIIYCAAIGACQGIFELRRAQAWTAALTRWCATQPDLVPFRGQCLIHRSQIHQLHGRWPDAMDEALAACERFQSGDPAVGGAHYQRGELLRLRGEFADAEQAYREASRHGHDPQPGLAQLRLAQGELDAAKAAIARVLGAAAAGPLRGGVLAAAAEIALAAGDHAAARQAADELTQLAATVEGSLPAVAAHVTGAVLLVEGDPTSAVATLQQAAAAWRDLDAPYDAARARVLLGLAYRELGDADSATLELDAARDCFAQLGAQPELARLDELAGARPSENAGGLTDREVQVLRLVAGGHSNRAIADELVISEHTVARHVQNIFAKLGVASRTGAAAFAFEHGIV